MWNPHVSTPKHMLLDYIRVCVCVCVCEVALVLFDSLRPYGLWPARLLRPWDSPGKNTGMDCHALLQDLPDPGIEPTSLTSPSLSGRFFTTSATCEAC